MPELPPLLETERFSIHVVGNYFGVKFYDKIQHKSVTVTMDELEEIIKTIKDRRQQNGTGNS